MAEEPYVEPSPNSNTPFQVKLTPQQFYSLQEIKKTTKRQKKESVTKLLDFDSTAKDVGIKDILYDEAGEQKLKRNKSKKMDKFLEDEVTRNKPKAATHSDRFLEEENVRIKTKAVAQFERLTQEQTNKCIGLLNQLKKNNNSWPFLTPVDPVKLKIPDYPSIIKEPMDLSTVEKNVRTYQYSTITQFHGDINKIWLNSYRYNQKGSLVYNLTVEIQKLYKRLISKDSNQPQQKSQVSIPPPPVVKKPSQQPSKQKTKEPKTWKIKSDMSKQFTISEKRQLCSDIKRLPKQYLSGVWSIVAGAKDGKELEFDIDQLEPEKIHRLQKYVNETIQTINLAQNKRLLDDKKDSVFSHEILSAESSFLLESDSDN